MRCITRSGVVALAGVAGLLVASMAFAAYNSLTLKIRYANPATTVIAVSGSPSDDATANVSIYLPTGTVVQTGQAPGTTIGTATAQAVVAAYGNALVPLAGKIIVAPPGAVAPKDQAECLQDAVPKVTWILQLSAAGQVIPVPVYVLSTVGDESALGPEKIVACLPPPDIPVAQGGAPNGAKIVSATFTLKGVLNQVTQGVWIAFWTPWEAGTGKVNQTGTVATPAAIAVGAVTLQAKKAGSGALVTGKVTQAGQGRPGAVSIWGAKGKGAMRKLGTVKTTAVGTYTFRARTGDIFQARVVAQSIAAPPLCQLVSAQLHSTPCINPTANGFTAKSASVHKH